MGDEKNVPGPRRRRIVGQTLVKRKVSMTPEEDKQLEVLAERANTSVSELLVTTALAPTSNLSTAEARALAATLMGLRNELCELVLVVKKEGESPADPEFLSKAKAASDRVFNAVESLVR